MRPPFRGGRGGGGGRGECELHCFHCTLTTSSLQVVISRVIASVELEVNISEKDEVVRFVVEL
jgi:hypothetical protein